MSVAQGTIGRLGVLIAVVSVCGCQKPLFPPNQPRTPYERYQRLRTQERPATRQNVHGEDEPALRERLRPLEER